jgi:hypothetical protein
VSAGVPLQDGHVLSFPNRLHRAPEDDRASFDCGLERPVGVRARQRVRRQAGIGEDSPRHAYGVLVYDSRGRGESEGSPVGFGWHWPKDVAGALAFLRGRPDVDPDRIGVLGLLRGADVLIQVAAEDKGLRVVVSDGATGGSFADNRTSGKRLQGRRTT